MTLHQKIEAIAAKNESLSVKVRFGNLSDIPYMQEWVQNVEGKAGKPNFDRPNAKQEAEEAARDADAYYKKLRKRLRKERGFEWRELRRGLLLGAASAVASAVATIALLVIVAIFSVR